MRRVLGTPLADYLPAFGLLLFTAAYLATAYRYAPAVRAFPVGVAWIMLLLLALDLATRSATGPGRALQRWLNPEAATSSARTGNATLAVCWLIGFAALLVVAGVLTAVPIFVFASLRWRGKRGFGTCALGAAAATLFIWLMFSVLLRLSLYAGLIFGS
jgi:hypothetical protein